MCIYANNVFKFINRDVSDTNASSTFPYSYLYAFLFFLLMDVETLVDSLKQIS